MKLYALSDLHLGFEENREALDTLGSHPDDWLILGGDLGETLAHLELALEIATDRFDRVLWVPGNHDLWTLPRDGPRGEAKYQALVELCRELDVITSEDPFVVWEGEGGPCALAPLFLLYDYTFRPDDVSADEALDWAAEAGIVCADERYLHPNPHPSREAWCVARCAVAEKRLEEAAAEYPLVIINPNRKIFEARKRETAALGAGEKLVLGHPLAATIGDSARCMQNLEKVLFTGPKTSDTVTFICD